MEEGLVMQQTSSTAPLPARGPPQRVPLLGRSVRLEPLDHSRHAADFFAVTVKDKALWTYMPYGPFDNLATMTDWLETCAQGDDPLFFSVVDMASGKAAGMTSFLNIRPEHGAVEIGHVWFSQNMRKSRAATEAIFLMLCSAFDEYGYRRVEWKCDSANEASRNAALRLGFSYEGIFRQHYIVKGRNRDTTWFAMIDKEWPALRRSFEAWLEPSNFDKNGQQKKPLRAFREENCSND